MISVGILPHGQCEPKAEIISTRKLGPNGTTFACIHLDAAIYGEHVSLNLSQLSHAEQLVYLMQLAKACADLADELERR